MSKLDELIKKYCPDGVEYKALDEVIISLNTGLNPRKFFKLNTNDAKNYYITIREIHNNKIQITDSTDKINDDALRLCNNRSNLDKGDILFSGTGTIGEIALIEDKPDNWNIKEGVYAIKPIQKMIISKYLMYILQTDTIRTAYMKKVAGGTVKSIPMKDLKKITIPVPPLPVQEEIVRILDSFTSLTVELQAELQARKIQFEQYSMLLFEQVKKKYNTCILSDICSVAKGKTPIQKAIPGDYPMVVTTTERRTSNSYQFDACSVCIPLVSSRGHGVASLNHVYYQTGKFALGNILCAVTPKCSDKVHAKYLYYYFEEAKDFTLVPLMKGGANVALRIEDIEKLRIPVPEIEIQKKIVSRLEKFDKLCNKLLPAEIAARQKQYEYYRDKLLTFKELS